MRTGYVGLGVCVGQSWREGRKAGYWPWQQIPCSGGILARAQTHSFARHRSVIASWIGGLQYVFLPAGLSCCVSPDGRSRGGFHQLEPETAYKRLEMRSVGLLFSQERCPITWQLGASSCLEMPILAPRDSNRKIANCLTLLPRHLPLKTSD